MTLSTRPPFLFPPCPFVAGPMITDSRLFVGRKDELHAITAHMTGVQPISMNVVGERRIGKSSLLYHFFQTWEQYTPDASHYVVVYLSLQNTNCQSRSSFYQAIAQELLNHPSVQGRNDLSSILSADLLDHTGFANTLKQWKQIKILPVLCLDEFETLLKYPDEFDDSFYDHLRSLMDSNALMLVVASHKSLDVYRQQPEHLLTSSFFNLGHVLPLDRLDEEEAVDLVRLPASTMSGAPATLSIEEQRKALQWGRKHPYLLQLAASFLCQARQQGKSTTWAWRRFEAEARRLSQPSSHILHW